MGIMGFRSGLLYALFSPMRNASAKGFKMKSPFNNNLPPKPTTLWLILKILKILIQNLKLQEQSGN
jgi:hypothetical protein